jgi:excinuclease ABC subunit B
VVGRGEQVNPFDLTKALEGAAIERLSPEVARLRLHTDLRPSGDQSQAIEKLIAQLDNGQERCILLGVTGSGKTFAMAHLIERLNCPTLILSHNKTLARQLYHEFSGLFPENAVEYFVSHYDYYQPEAYLPRRDLYIDKELSINERIEQERFATVASLVTRPDVVIVSSVSCIYGLNSPETFLANHARVHVGQDIEPIQLVRELVALQYTRTSADLNRGEMRLRGEVFDVWMPSRDDPMRIRFGFDGIEKIQVCDPVTWEVLDELDEAWIHPKQFFMTSSERFQQALEGIERELEERVAYFLSAGQDIEAHRLEQRTQYDLEMLREVGHCTAVENYSMHFDGRSHGERPWCLLDFMAACAQQFHGDVDKYLVIMDESHVTLPQVGGMYAGDKSRKENLIDHGFRLPSAADNRPLKIHEFQQLVPQMLYVSATPGERELRHLCEITDQPVAIGLQHIQGGGGVDEPELSKRSPESQSMYEMLQEIDNIARMEIRPTGLLDPAIEVRPTEGQVQDLLSEINERSAVGERVLVTVLTIKFAEEVAAYLNKMGVKAHHLHSEIDTLERTEIIKALRLGIIDVIVGINLLREGLDIPEVSLVTIFDADREGFLRNERSLLQTIGRASRNSAGKVILYSDGMSNAMNAAIQQTLERRERQNEFNQKHGITPTTIQKALPEMGVEASELLAGTSGKGAGGGRRLVSNRGGAGGRSGDYWVQRLGTGAGRWGSDDVVSTLSQPLDFDYPIAEAENPIGENGSKSSQLSLDPDQRVILLKDLQKAMKQAAQALDFERAAALRDRIFELEQNLD